jgi:hypothetical protein
MLTLTKLRPGKSRVLSVLYKTLLQPHLALKTTSTLALQIALTSETELVAPEAEEAMEAPLLAGTASSLDQVRWALQVDKPFANIERVFSKLRRSSHLVVL